MKEIKSDKIGKLPGRKLEAGDTFFFRCHPDIACFNLCCRNLNLFLYPYDVIRLKNHLGISSDQFLEEYTDAVLREGSWFPEVLLRMAENKEKTCPFLTDTGCSVYPDRPDSCRSFPVEHGLFFNEKGQSETLSFYRPPDFCLGQHEDQELTPESWRADQEAQRYHQMTVRWAEIRSLFQKNPWGTEGPQGPKAKMAFMAVYNIDSFRDFVFNSSFLKRYKIKKDLQKKFRRKDEQLLQLSFEWIAFYLWGIRPRLFRMS
ncbi:MAG: YkgJ family cysteine cluster protein [Desulfococcaceae bacterium]|jgi:Fe-S-cluster containining protein|nr:YkgJ family cysteine cluster protein [Desulfococcaceae bacterium]